MCILQSWGCSQKRRICNMKKKNGFYLERFVKSVRRQICQKNDFTNMRSNQLFNCLASKVFSKLKYSLHSYIVAIVGSQSRSISHSIHGYTHDPIPPKTQHLSCISCSMVVWKFSLENHHFYPLSQPLLMPYRLENLCIRST